MLQYIRVNIQLRLQLVQYIIQYKLIKLYVVTKKLYFCLPSYVACFEIRSSVCRVYVMIEDWNIDIWTKYIILSFYTVLYNVLGARGGSVGWGSALQVGRSRVRFPHYVTGIFHWRIPSGRTMTPGVDSASNRNEYHEYFLGSKGGRDSTRITLPLPT